MHGRSAVRSRALVAALLLLLEGCCAPPGNFFASLYLSLCGDPRYWPHPPPDAPPPAEP